mmetsp:Transcript_36227/g.84987  ORF Transcript_36227/g.84987 Transcript_36227/m.84987 type:complete len:329 (-) Transcript_36227:25-1011(-)
MPATKRSASEIEQADNMAAEAIPFFDPHFHIWDISSTSKTGHEPSNLFPPGGKEVYLREDYEAEFASLPPGLKFEGGVYIEAVSVCHADVSGPSYSEHCLAELRFAADALRGGNYVIVPTCALQQPDAPEVLQALAKEPLVRGIRQILNYEPSFPRNGKMGELLEDPSWKAGFAMLQGLGLSFDLQINPNQYEKAAKFLTDFPDTSVIIDHIGTPKLKDLTDDADAYWRGMEALAKLPKVYMKLSFLCAVDASFDEKPVIGEAVHRLVALFGVDRCMFSSNYPVDCKCPGFTWTAERLFKQYLLLAEKYSQEDRLKLFAGTAKRAYRV